MTDTIKILLPYIKIEDPHLCTDSHALLFIRRLLFPGLLQHNGRTAQGVITESWEQTDSGKTWRFHLKKGLYFENGKELNADDVVYSLLRASDPRTAGQLFTVTYNEYFGKAEIFAADPYTVVLKNPDPIADLEELLPDLAILPVGWKSYDDGTGAGPYTLTKYDSQSASLTLKSDSQAGPGAPKKLHFLAVPEAKERSASIQSGTAHLALDPPTDEIDLLKKGDTTGIIGWDTSLSVIFFIECKAAPLKDIRVRQALNYAVDSEALVREVAYGHAKPLNGPFSDRHFAYDPQVPRYPYDPQAARSLLQQAGLSEGFQLEVHAPTTIPDEGPALAEFLADSFRRIGIDAVVRLHKDRSEYARKITAKELHGLFCFDSSPLSSYKVLHEKIDSRFAGAWWQGYHNPEVNSLISQAAANSETKARQQLYRRAYRILRDEAPWVFLYQPRRFWATHTSSGLTEENFSDLGFFII